MTFRHLDDEMLDDVRAAAREAGFNSDAMLDGLAAEVSPAFRGQFMTGPNPNVKLHTITAKMNTTRVLVSGEVPFERWLRAAVQFAAGTEQELVFRAALERISVDADPQLSRAAEDDIAAAPRSDGELEVAIGSDDTLGAEFLVQGARAARSVVRLLVHRHFDAQPSFVASGKPDHGFGTGWLIGPRLLATNHHVVRARHATEPEPSPTDFDLQCRATVVEFDAFGDESAVVTTDSIECVAGDPELDYAVLRTSDSVPPRPPLRLRPNPLTRVPTNPLKERANVLQHPGGESMRLGFRDNFILTANATALSYLTDTAGGSSGSPIFDDEWFVAGLHRGWRTIEEGPVIVRGTRIRQENYSTPIGRILEHLREHHTEIHAEIMAGQGATL